MESKGLKTEVMIELLMLGLSLAEIGKISGQSYDAVYKRIRRARKDKSVKIFPSIRPMKYAKIGEGRKIMPPFIQR